MNFDHQSLFGAGGTVRSLSPPFDRSRMKAGGSFGFGIEEEYFLSHIDSRKAALETPDSLFDDAHAATEGRVDREMLQAQVEIALPPFTDGEQARTELRYIRTVLSKLASTHGLAILACGTHPAGRWQETRHSDKQRYDTIMDDLQIVGRRNMLCGMHVHVEVPDPLRRVDIMYRLIPYLPLFLALSTSSPLWQSHLTGLKGYRLAVYDELPRTGLPELIRTNAEYDEYIDALKRSNVIENASYVWWMVRPSVKYPTLELRAPDCCTRLDDAVAIASLYRALVRHLYFHPDHNRQLTPVCRALALENKWRAQRYGTKGTFATRDGEVSVRDHFSQLVDFITEDIEVLGCGPEIDHCGRIVQQGTSADQQIEIYQSTAARRGPDAALVAVTDWIAEATVNFVAQP
jgi:carboxylate-amine ligase